MLFESSSLSFKDKVYSFELILITIFLLLIFFTICLIKSHTHFFFIIILIFETINIIISSDNINSYLYL